MLNEYDELMKENSEGGNEYDNVVAGSINAEKTALAGAMYVAEKKDPVKQAEYERISQETNLPPDFIERNYEKVVQQYKIKKSPDDVYNKAPKSSTWLANPNNAALSKEELDQIISMENSVGVVGKKDKGYLKDLGNAATTGSYQLKSSAWQLALAFDKADLDEAANEIAASYKKQAELRNQAPQYAKDFQKEMEGDIQDIDKAFGQFASSYDEIAEGNILNALKNFTVGGAETVYETLDMIGSSVKSKEQIKGLVYSSTEQLANSAPGLVGGVSGAAAGAAVAGLPGAAVGGVIGGFTGSAPAEIGASIGEIASKRGYDFSNPEEVKRFYKDPKIKKEIIDAAIRKGVTTAAVDSLFNLFAGAKVAKTAGKGVKTVAKEAVKDVGTQAAGETLGEFAGQVAREKGIAGTSFGEAASEGVTSLGTSMVEVPVGAAIRLRKELSDNPIEAAGQLVEKADEAIAVEEKVVALKNIGEEVKKMEVTASVPGKVAELVNVMVGDSETKSVFFQSSDWKKYWEDKGLNPVEEISKILPDGAERLQEAENNGHQLEIPLAEFVGKVAATEYYDSLVEQAALREGGMTFAEARTVKSELPAALEAIAAEATRPDRVMSEQVQVQKDIESQMIQAGVRPKEARLNAKIMAMTFNARAKKLGKSALQLYKDENITITREGAIQGKTFFQSKVPKGFYSKLEKNITDKMGKAATIEQVQGILKDIKPEERKWSGIDDFLNGKTKVSKQEILDYLRANQLKIEEVRKGGSAEFNEDESILDIYSNGDDEFYNSVEDENGDIILNNGPFGSEREAREDYNYWVAEQRGDSEGSTKFSKYILPGGENYREVLLTMPPQERVYKLDEAEQKLLEKYNTTKDKLYKFATKEELDELVRIDDEDKATEERSKQVFKSSHFDEENILAHTRLTDRVDSEGNKVLFIEEIQSDWHQAGREKGYKEPLPPQENFEDFLKRNYPEKAKDSFALWQNKSNELYKEWSELQDKILSNQRSVPDAPFRKSWHEFTFKKILLEAAQKGYKKVAWTTGDQQAERYKNALLAKVDKFEVKKNSDGTYDLNALSRNDSVKKESSIKPDRINDLVGKSLGNQLIEAANNANGEISTLEGDSFNIGGEGMRGFYDKILVNFANSFAKKFNAKVLEDKVSIDDGGDSAYYDTIKNENDSWSVIKVYPQGSIPSTIATFKNKDQAIKRTVELNAEISKKETATVHSLDITPQLKEAALNEGFALFQDERGKIIFGDDSVNIALLANADRSTFLHETAHLYLNQMMQDYATINALPEKSELQTQFIKDSENILKWLEVNSFEEITVDHHEKFARGFEAYLMEGKAPSKDLRRIFALFRSWLLDIYKGMRALNVDLSDEVREVFGRMIVVDDQIESAVSEQRISDFSQKLQLIGISKVQSERYAKLRDEHRIKATEILQGKVLDDYKRTKESFYKDRFNKIKKEVTANVEKIPVYAFLDSARSGKKNVLGVPLKLDRKILLDMYGEDQVKKLPRGVLSDTEGNHPDIIVGMFGFDSSAQMVDALQKAIPKKDVIQQESQRIMDIRYPSLLSMEDNLKDEASKAVHNDMREEVMEMELQIMLDENFPMAKNIIKQTVKRMPSKKFAKEEANKTIGRRLISELKPHVFRRAEAKAAKEAGEFLVKGDIDNAIESKNKERLNFSLYNSAVENKEQYLKDLKFFKKLFKKDEDIAKSRDMNYVDAARAVLANFGLGQTDKSASDYLELIKRYDPSAYEGLMPLIESLTFKPMEFNKLTVNQFNEVSALVNGLWDLAKAAKEIDINGEKFSKEQAIQELIISMADLKKEKPEIRKAAPGKKEEWKIAILGTKASLRRVESWVDYMDLGKVDGPFRKYIYNLATQGLNDYRLDKVKFIKKYEELLKPMREAFKPKKIISKELNVEFRHKGELLGALLHTGNDSNKKKLLVGKGWGSVDDSGTLDSKNWDKFIDGLIEDSTLTKQDFDFVQSVWDLFEELKPAAQRSHKKIYGRYFAEITANEFSNKFGVYRGGYAPAMADKMEAVDARVREDANIIKDAANAFMFPQTDKGFTKGRVEYNAPLVIDMAFVGQHIDKVLRFTHLEYGVKQAYSLISNNMFKQELNDIDNTLGTDMLVPWLQRIATQQVERQGNFIFNKQLDGFFKYVRKNTGMNIMFLNVVNALQQVTGFSIAAIKVNKRNLTSSLFAYLSSPKKSSAEIISKSKFMETRLSNQMFESFEAIDEILTNPSKYEQLKKFGGKHAYILQQFLQNGVDSTVWMAAYNQAIEQGISERLAVDSADSAVRLTQSSMNPEDISNFEVGSATYRAFNMFYNYFNMQANLLGTEFAKSIRQSGLKKSFPRLLYVYFMGLAVPAILSEMMVRAASGEDWDEDNDGFYLDNIFSMMFYAQSRNAIALVPLVGVPVNAGVNAMNDKPYDDRMSVSPAISVIESAVVGTAQTGKALFDDEKDISKKKATKDFLSTIGVFTGLPVMPLGKPIGYIIDVEEGRANPSGPVDYSRGLITGRPGEQ